MSMVVSPMCIGKDVKLERHVGMAVCIGNVKRKAYAYAAI